MVCFYLGIERHNYYIMDFYLLINNSKQGPYSIEELASKDLSPSTMVWTQGYTDWKPAKQVPELHNLLANLPPDAPTYRNTQMPKTWMVESILVTILCCLPFGIMGIIHASKIESLHQNKLFEEAIYHSNQAKKWAFRGFFCGIIIGILYLTFPLVTIFSIGN